MSRKRSSWTSAPSPYYPLVCSQCGAAINHPGAGHCDTGYATITDTDYRVCYQCALNLDLEQARATGHLFAYVELEQRDSLPDYGGGGRWHSYATGNGRHYSRPRAIQTWPGLPLSTDARMVSRWRSNFGDWRMCIHFTLPAADGTREEWSGIYYCDAGDYIRARRLKARAS